MITIKGILEINKDKEYIVNGHNISKIFNAIYMADVDVPRLLIMIMKQDNRILLESGEIYLDKNVAGQYKFHLRETNLDEILLRNSDTEMEISIKTEDVLDEQLWKL